MNGTGQLDLQQQVQEGGRLNLDNQKKVSCHCFAWWVETKNRWNLKIIHVCLDPEPHGKSSCTVFGGSGEMTEVDPF